MSAASSAAAMIRLVLSMWFATGPIGTRPPSDPIGPVRGWGAAARMAAISWVGLALVIWAAAVDPADVPMIRSASVTSNAASNRPAMTPINHASDRHSYLHESGVAGPLGASPRLVKPKRVTHLRLAVAVVAPGWPGRGWKRSPGRRAQMVSCHRPARRAAMTPPSMSRSVPVMKPASGPRRKAAAAPAPGPAHPLGRGHVRPDRRRPGLRQTGSGPSSRSSWPVSMPS
jgi:hypothetical protein